jgi:hypothetical protein
MKLYRFSPIKNEDELQQAIEHIHFGAYKLCQVSFGKYLPNSGNIGIFCHYQDEYENLVEIRKNLTEISENPNQKYFQLHHPIVIPAQGDVPETTYTFLYIRQPDPYRHHVGDVDFYLPEDEYFALKKEMESGREVPGARLFPSPRLEMIEMYDPDCDVLAYVSTAKMADIVKTTKSEA